MQNTARNRERLVELVTRLERPSREILPKVSESVFENEAERMLAEDLHESVTELADLVLNRKAET